MSENEMTQVGSHAYSEGEYVVTSVVDAFSGESKKGSHYARTLQRDETVRLIKFITVVEDNRIRGLVEKDNSWIDVQSTGGSNYGFTWVKRIDEAVGGASTEESTTPQERTVPIAQQEFQSEIEMLKLKRILFQVALIIAVINMVFSMLSICSTQWVMTEFSDHPTLKKLSFGPIQYCLTTTSTYGDTYSCSANYVDTMSNWSAFSMMRGFALLTLCFSCIVFLSIWDPYSFTNSRTSLCILNILSAVVTLLVWSVVGSTGVDVTSERDWVWATFAPPYSEDLNNVEIYATDETPQGAGYYYFIVSNIAVPLLFFVLFYFFDRLHKSDFERAREELRHSVLSKLVDKHHPESMPEVRKSLLDEKSLYRSYESQVDIFDTWFCGEDPQFDQEVHAQTTRAKEVLLDKEIHIRDLDYILRQYQMQQKGYLGMELITDILRSSLYYIIIIFFVAISLSIPTSHWGEEYIWDNNNFAHVDNGVANQAYQESIQDHSLSRRITMPYMSNEDFTNRLGQASIISYGPFSSCMKWRESDGSNSKYEICFGSAEGNEDDVANLLTLRTLLYVTQGLLILIAMSSSTQIFVESQVPYLKECMTCVLPSITLVFVIVCMVMWVDTQADGDDFLPQDRDGVWVGEVGRDVALFLIFSIVFLFSACWWNFCCAQCGASLDDEEDSDDESGATCIDKGGWLNGFCVNMGFLSGEDDGQRSRRKSISSAKEPKECIPKDYIHVMGTLVSLILMIIGAIGNWRALDFTFLVNGEPQDFEARSGLLGTDCVNAEGYTFCGEAYAFWGGRSRYTKFQVVVIGIFISLIFIFYHLFLDLRIMSQKKKNSLERKRLYCGLISWLTGMISFITFAAAGGDRTIPELNLAAINSTSTITVVRRVMPMFLSGCDSVWLKSVSGSLIVSSDGFMAGGAITFIVGLCIYTLTLGFQIYTYMTKEK